MTIGEIYQQMKDAFTQETGMEVHETGEAAVRLYTLASEVYGLYAQNQWTLAQCFPQTAQGEYLDYHAALRGLVRQAATKAVGTLRFSIDLPQQEPLVIEAGTSCITAALVAFETTQRTEIPAGSLFAQVPAQAVLPGAGGNVAAGAIRAMSVAPVGVSGCENPAGFAGGTDGEDDKALRVRVLESFRRMPNGANAAYYEQEALRIPQVVAVNVLGRNRGNGTVDIVIAEAGGYPSEETLEAVRAHIVPLREVAVDVQVLPPALIPCDVQVQVAAKMGNDIQQVQERVRQALRAYFDGRLLGKAVLRANLASLIFSVKGVENYSIQSPATDIPVAVGSLVQLDDLRVEEM